MKDEVDLEAKRIHRLGVIAKKQERRRQTRLRVRCFWSRPFGHAWVQGESLFDPLTCAGCGCRKSEY